MNFSQSPPRFRGFCPIPVILSPFHANRGLTGGLATLPQGNQEPLMVKRNVENPQVSMMWARQWNVILFPLQCFDTVGCVTEC